MLEGAYHLTLHITKAPSIELPSLFDRIVAECSFKVVYHLPSDNGITYILEDSHLTGFTRHNEALIDIVSGLPPIWMEKATNAVREMLPQATVWRLNPH
jgi:hypothetical protein